jgi:hypothetical protein
MLEHFFFQDISQIIIDYLDPKSILKFSSVSKQIKELIDTEITWERLCYIRWNVSSKIRKSILAKTWRQAYEILHLSQKIPQTPYTDKSCKIFGKSKNKNIYSWLLLGHTPDCRIKNKCIEVRICIQNCEEIPVYIPFSPNNFIVSCMFEDHLEDLQSIKINVLNHKNSSYSFADGFLCLKTFSYCILTIYILCPDDIIFETDFLTRAFCINVGFISQKDYNSKIVYHDEKTNSSILQYITCKFKDEMSFYEHYSFLPGGYVVLNNYSSFSLV